MRIKKLLLGLMTSATLLTPLNLQAGDFKASAEFTNHFEIGNASPLFQKGSLANDESFAATMRYRLGFTYTSESENLKAHLLLQVGPYIWGRGQTWNGAPISQGSLDSEITDIRLRLGYLDWTVPNTELKFRMGYQTLRLPGFVGNSPITGESGSMTYHNRSAGISFEYPLNDNIELSGFWTRGSDQNGFIYFNDSRVKTLGDTNNTGDLYAAVVDFNYEKFRIIPWFMYADVGRNVQNFGFLPLGNDDDFKAYYMGASMEFLHENWRFAFDGVYAVSTLEDSQRKETFDGYSLAALLSYRTKNGVPALKAWYSSGDKNVTGFEKLDSGVSGFRAQPIGDLGRPSSIMSFYMPTTMFYGEQIQDNGLSCYRGYNPDGTWGVALEWGQFSFLKNLSHTARVAYIGGSNEIINDAIPASVQYMGTDDRLWEFNLNNYMWFTKNMLATVELGTILPDFQGTNEDDPVYRATLSFIFFF